MKKKLGLFLANALIVGSLLTACGGGNDTSDNGSAAKDAKKDGLNTNIVTIATGGSSGPYNIIGTTLANEYSNVLGVNSKPQSTGASVENINLIKEGKAEM